jgi:hypothetical protein
MNTSAAICTANLTSVYGNKNTMKKKPEIPTEARKDHHYLRMSSKSF